MNKPDQSVFHFEPEITGCLVYFCYYFLFAFELMAGLD